MTRSCTYCPARITLAGTEYKLAPDLATWTGRRDRALLMLACQTGLRATELTSLAIGDVHLGTGAHVSCLGKGRKQRVTPLTPATVTVLRGWLDERGGLPADPLFITRRGTPLSRDALVLPGAEDAGLQGVGVQGHV